MVHVVCLQRGPCLGSHIWLQGGCKSNANAVQVENSTSMGPVLDWCASAGMGTPPPSRIVVLTDAVTLEEIQNDDDYMYAC